MFTRRLAPLLASVATLLRLAWPARAQEPPTSVVMHPTWAQSATIYEVNIRQYTPEGTFRAFETHLPRLQQMGVSILWLMPIHPIGALQRKGTLGSYYSVRDYRGINPEFGNADDFRRLVEQAHASGMKVILDWVGNHCAWDNALISEHPDWFTHDSLGNMQPPIADWADVVDLNYDHPGLRSYMIESMQYWMREFAVDGFRCDVTGMVPLDFWSTARAELNKIRPVFLLAEDENPDCHRSAFDMTYSWSLHHLLRDIAHGTRDMLAVDTLLAAERKHYPASAIRMRFTDNHDENSWNKSVFERMGDGAAAFAVLTATLPGMPLVYSGQEAALNRSLQFFDKDSIDWSALPYADLYTKLLHLKREHPALHSSELDAGMTRLTSAPAVPLYAFVREANGRRVLVFLNLSAHPLNTTLDLSPFRGDYDDVLSNTSATVRATYSVVLPSWGYRVLAD